MKILCAKKYPLSSHVGCLIHALHLTVNDITARYVETIKIAKDLIRNSKLGGEVRALTDETLKLLKPISQNFFNKQ